MPEIIDLMTLPKDKCPSFVVDTTQDYIVPSAPAVPNYTLQNDTAKKTFLNGDSFSILTTGIALPECFTFWKNPVSSAGALPSNSIIIIGATVPTFYRIDVLGSNQKLYVPMENFELAMDVFCNVTKALDIGGTTLLNQNFQLYTGQFLDPISMKGIPAAFNGKTFLIAPFFKILHNFPLI